LKYIKLPETEAKGEGATHGTFYHKGKKVFQSNPIQSNPIHSNPIQSNPIQSNPITINYQLSIINYQLSIEHLWLLRKIPQLTL
jgi:hypothetical protein